MQGHLVILVHLNSTNSRKRHVFKDETKKKRFVCL